MRAGRPSSKTKAAAKAAPENQLVDRTRGARLAKSPKSAAAPRKSTLIKILLKDSRLTASDKRTIKAAAKAPLDASDLAAMVAYQVIFTRRAYEADELTAKDAIVSLNKAASQMQAAIQLGESDAGGATSISVEFTLAGLPSAEHGKARRPPGPVGDIIDVEA
mgnify:FL=1